MMSGAAAYGYGELVRGGGGCDLGGCDAIVSVAVEYAERCLLAALSALPGSKKVYSRRCDGA